MSGVQNGMSSLSVQEPPKTEKPAEKPADAPEDAPEHCPVSYLMTTLANTTGPLV